MVENQIREIKTKINHTSEELITSYVKIKVFFFFK